MPYEAYALVSVIIFSLVHLYARKIEERRLLSQSRFLSFGGGVAIAYVFIDLLPKLALQDDIARNTIPYFEKHAYLMALFGFLLFYAVKRSEPLFKSRSAYFRLSLGSYALFNFMVGYAIVDKDNPEVQPLILFTFAMALHYFVNDYTLSKAHGKEYRSLGKWFLIAFLLLGWLAGVFLELSEAAIALVSAFIGGGVIMNVVRNELPEKNPNSLPAFLASAALYTLVLLMVGR